MRKVFLGVLTIGAISLLAQGMLQATDQSEVKYSLIGKLAPSNLAEPGDIVAVKSFELTPNGSQLAIAYQTWKPEPPGQIHLQPYSYTWIALWDIATRKITRNVRLEVKNDLSVPPHNSPPGPAVWDDNRQTMLRATRNSVSVSPDNRFLIVMAMGKMWVLDISSFSILYSINPSGLAEAVPYQTYVVNPTLLAAVYEDGVEHFQVFLLDLPTGKQISTWTSAVPPDSFSPDGKLAVAPDADTYYNKGGETHTENNYLPFVEVFDARTGSKIRSIPTRFTYRKSWLISALWHGPLVARFLTNDRIIVTTFGNSESEQPHSGFSLQIIDVINGRIVSQITPERFSPAGILVESPDRRFFAVQSSRRLLVFAQGSAVPTAVIQYPDVVTSLWFLPPSISNDGPNVAISNDGEEVSIFRVRQ